MTVGVQYTRTAGGRPQERKGMEGYVVMEKIFVFDREYEVAEGWETEQRRLNPLYCRFCDRSVTVS